MGDPRDKLSQWWPLVGERAREHRLWWKHGGRGSGRIIVEEANLRAAKLSGLSGLRLVDCDLGGSTLLGELLETELVGCSLDGVIVDGDLSQSELVGCHAHTATFRESRFAKSRFDGCVLARCDLSRVDLTAASVKDTQLTGSVLRDATLSLATFRGCDLRDADLTGTRALGPLGASEETRFFGCDFRGVDWQGRRLKDVTFDHCAFAGAIGIPVIEGSLKVVDGDFSKARDGSELGDAERLLALWR
jgi:uncharacterized protein YjbI with pentapeptide repeats